MYDVIIVGAGPCGISAGVEAKRRGLKPLLIDKGCIVNSIYHFPTHMKFFSTPELLEVGGLPFVCYGDKPVRTEALKYYRAVVDKYDLKVNTYEKVTKIEKHSEGYRVTTDYKGENRYYEAENIVIATGYYDNPNRLNIPGGDLPKVHHYFREGHPYSGLNVLVIGGKNSAVDAALELQQAGANVTMSYRRSSFSKSVKAWVKPLIESAINKEWIHMYWESYVRAIYEDSVLLEQNGRQFTIPNDVVFAMTGYRPDYQMLIDLGVKFDPETGAPIFNPETMETEIPGLYIAGVIAAGYDANSIFIENGRFHGEKIAHSIEMKKKKAALG